MFTNKFISIIQLKFVFIIALFFLSEIGISQQSKKKSFYLKEYEINDTTFYNNLSSIIFSDSTCFKNRDSYVLNIIYDTASTKYNFIILYVPIDKDNMYGFFRIENKLCFIDKSFLKFKNVLSLTNRKKLFYYYENHVKNFVVEHTEEFSTWFLKYELGKFIIIEKYCIK